MRQHIRMFLWLVLTYVPLSVAADLPHDVVRDIISPHCNDPKAVVAFASTNHYWRSHLLGNNNGAKLRWLDFLKTDFEHRFHGSEFPDLLFFVADVEASPNGTNQFYEAYAQIQRENPTTLEAYGVIVARVFHTSLHAFLEQVRANENQEREAAAHCVRRARCLEFWGLVTGVAFGVGGGLLIYASHLAAGIPLIVVGGILTVAAIAGKVWGECRLGPGADMGDRIAHIAQEQVDAAHEQTDDIERQLGTAFATQVNQVHSRL